MNLNIGFPDLSFPDVSLSDISFPDISLPDIRFPDISFSDINFLGISLSDINFPDISFSDINFPDISLPPNTIFIVTAILIVVAIIISAVVAPRVVVGIIRAFGFTSKGILAGSKAAVFMAWYLGKVTAGSICAILQSIGAAGLSVTGSILTSILGAAIAVTLAIILLLKSYPFQEPIDDCLANCASTENHSLF
ncbi:hypothetical protein BG000_008222 [Podila horticola]|nr:hypothetical protein BG000_008222 [Podila horticola]